MKEGDILICKQNIYRNEISKWISYGKTYTVLYDKNSNTHYIIDDDGDINETIISGTYLDKFFMTLKEIRNLKLEKINESSLHK